MSGQLQNPFPLPNPLPVSLTSSFQNDIAWQILAGTAQIPGVSFSFVIGTSSNIGTTFGTMWLDGTLYAPPTVGVQMSLSSTSVNDTLLGTGARVVYLEYLDSNYDVQSEVIFLNGLLPVLTVATDIFRVQFIQVVSAGALGGNDGSVWLGTGVVVAGVPTVKYSVISKYSGLSGNISRVSFKTVPNNKFWFAPDYSQSGSDKLVEFSALFTIFGLPRFIAPLFEQQGGVFNNNFKLQAPIPPKTDINIIARTNTGTANANYYLPYMEVDLSVYQP